MNGHRVAWDASACGERYGHAKDANASLECFRVYY